MDLLSIIPVCSHRYSEEAELLLVDGVAQRLEYLHITFDFSPWFEVVAIEEVEDCEEEGQEYIDQHQNDYKALLVRSVQIPTS